MHVFLCKLQVSVTASSDTEKTAPSCQFMLTGTKDAALWSYMELRLMLSA